MANEEQVQHIKTILTHANPYSDLADDMRSYARNFPDEISATFTRYARNLEAFHEHYSYPIKIYAGWMGDRAKLLRPDITVEEARQDLAPRLFDFIENRSKELKNAAMIHARMMYVSLWSIYDSFLADFVRGVCKEFPVLFSTTRAEATLKKLVDLTTVISSFTGESGRRLGDMIFATNDPPSHRELQKLLLESTHLGASEEVQKAFKDNRLYLLEKRRHLVAHNAGAIDQKYLKETASTGRAGDLVEVSALDIMQSSSAVHTVAFQLAAELTGYIKATRGL
jgi:hypothetical protein